MARKLKSWEEIRGETPLDERRVATYERLMDAEELIAHARYEHGVSDETILDALCVSEPQGARFEDEDELYLTVLGRYVAALGGLLELRAVFPEGAVVVLCEPEGESVPALEAPALEAPALEAPALEAPALEAPALEAPAQEAPAQEAPPKKLPAQGAPPEGGSDPA